MIKLTDQTLRHIQTKDCDTAVLQEFYHLLFQCGADFVELDEKTAERLADDLDWERTVLHLQNPREVCQPFARCVCRFTEWQNHAPMLYEVRVNDVREINLLGRYAHLKQLRIVGLGDLLLHDAARMMEQVRDKLPKTKIELCPTNEYGCAGAILNEWLSTGSGMGVTSFLGTGGTAPLEQLMMSLRLGAKRHKPKLDLSGLPRLRTLFTELTGTPVPSHQPVVGSAIFEVESGVHVDGILKNAALYEPFPPESVGMERKIVIGKHSGQSSLRHRLQQLGCAADKANLSRLLQAVRQKSETLQRALTDTELLALAHEVEDLE